MAARPGRIVSQILVDVPLPRGDDLRTTALYNERCRTASRALTDALSPQDRM